jgi:hypothetical protein
LGLGLTVTGLTAASVPHSGGTPALGVKGSFGVRPMVANPPASGGGGGGGSGSFGAILRAPALSENVVAAYRLAFTGYVGTAHFF